MNNQSDIKDAVTACDKKDAPAPSIRVNALISNRIREVLGISVYAPVFLYNVSNITTQGFKDDLVRDIHAINHVGYEYIAIFIVGLFNGDRCEDFIKIAESNKLNLIYVTLDKTNNFYIFHQNEKHISSLKNNPDVSFRSLYLVPPTTRTHSTEEVPMKLAEKDTVYGKVKSVLGIHDSTPIFNCAHTQIKTLNQTIKEGPEKHGADEEYNIFFISRPWSNAVETALIKSATDFDLNLSFVKTSSGDDFYFFYKNNEHAATLSKITFVTEVKQLTNRINANSPTAVAGFSPSTEKKVIASLVIDPINNVVQTTFPILDGNKIHPMAETYRRLFDTAVGEYLDQLNFNESGDFTKKIVISVES